MSLTLIKLPEAFLDPKKQTKKPQKLENRPRYTKNILKSVIRETRDRLGPAVQPT